MHSTSNLEDEYIGSGKRLWNSIRKHGLENHTKEILEFLEDRNALKAREKELVNEELLKDKQCMNLAIGGEGGFINKEAARAGALAMNKKTWADPEFRKRQTYDTSELNKKLYREGKKQPISKHFTWKDKKMSTDHIESIRISNLGKQSGEKNSQFGKCWIFNDVTSRSIDKINLSEYLKLGWKKGRKFNFTLK